MATPLAQKRTGIGPMMQSMRFESVNKLKLVYFCEFKWNIIDIGHDTMDERYVITALGVSFTTLGCCLLVLWPSVRIVAVTWSFVPPAWATLYHIWRGLAKALCSLHLPLNTLCVYVSLFEWTIVPSPKGTQTKSLVFQFSWCLISPCDKFMRFNSTMAF